MKKPKLSDSHFFDFNPLLDKLEDMLYKRVEEEKYESAALIKEIIDILSGGEFEMKSEEIDRWGVLTERLMKLEK
jgi:protein-arginine kinase activator protein McsA